MERASTKGNIHTVNIHGFAKKSLLLVIGSLHWLSSWQWWPLMRGCRLYHWLHCGHHFWKFMFVCRHHFQKFMKTQKNRPFLRPKYLLWYFFVFHPGIYMGRWDLLKTAPDLVKLGPQTTVCNLHPDTLSHHPVLDFHTQITRKYSTAMCLYPGYLQIYFYRNKSIVHFIPIIKRNLKKI